MFEELPVTTDKRSPNLWAAQLANLINSTYGGIVQVGVRNADGSISYRADDPASNRVWVAGSGDTFALDIKKLQDD